MTQEISIEEYTSDYSGEQRFAIRVDGKFPQHLDFDTRGDAESHVSSMGGKFDPDADIAALDREISGLMAELGGL